MSFNKYIPKLHNLLAFSVLVVSVAVMLGWIFQIPSIIQIRPDFPPMVFNTSFLLMMLAVGILFSDRDYFKIGRICAVFVMLFAGFTFMQYPLGVSFGIDTFFVKPFYNAGSAVPGRMAASTAIAMMFTALALFFNKVTIFCQFVRTSAGALVFGLGMIGIGGYVFSINSQYGWGSFARMAFHTSVCFVILSSALLLQLRVRMLAHGYGRKYHRPFIVLIAGVCVTLALVQMLLVKDYQKNRAITTIRANALLEGFDSTFYPLQKALGRMGRRLINGRYDSKSFWEIDADSYVKDFEGIRRLMLVDKNLTVKWAYPDDQFGRKLVGMKIWQDANVGDVIKEVVKSKKPALSGIITLKSGGEGFLMLYPVINADKLVGLVNVAIDAHQFFERVASAPGYFVTVKEGDRELMSTGVPSAVYSRDWSQSVSYRTMNTNWDIIITPRPELVQQNSSYLPAIVTVFGMSVSLLLSMAVLFYLRARESEKRMRGALEWQKAGRDSIPLLIIQMDRLGHIININKAAESLLNYTQDEVVGKLPWMFGDNTEIMEIRGKMEERLHRSIPLGAGFLEGLFESGLNRGTERIFMAKDGRRINVVLRVTRVTNEKNETTGYLGIAEDITQQKERERLLKEQEEKILVSSRLASLGEMAAGIAHEINNPLAVMSGYISVLRKNLGQKGLGSDIDVNRRVDAIDSMVQRIAKIVKGLRSYAHETHHGDFEETAVETIVDDTLAFCYEKFKGADVKLVAHIEPHLKVRCRPYQISQVLLNLLNNAYDAVENQPYKRVTIEAQKRGDNLEISVTDTGPGIPFDLREKIMQPFFTTKEVGQGVGLGLSISQGIIQAHNGKFYLDEESAETRFVILLPGVSSFN